jgi:hypothetical protein
LLIIDLNKITKVTLFLDVFALILAGHESPFILHRAYDEFYMRLAVTGYSGRGADGYVRGWVDDGYENDRHPAILQLGKNSHWSGHNISNLISITAFADAT